MLELILFLIVVAAFGAQHFVRWLAWRKLPKPKGYVGEIVVNVYGRRWRVRQERLSPVDSRLMGFQVVNDHGDTRVTDAALYGYRAEP